MIFQDDDRQAGGASADILVVDDEEWNRKLMKSMLTPLEYNLHYAEDGIEALEQISAVEPDAILLDLMMPKMDGYEVARRLKESAQYRHIPLIIITGSREESNRIRALELGVDDFITKPVNRSELIARLRSSLKIKAYHDGLLRYQDELEQKVESRTRELQQSFEKIKEASLETIYRLTRAAEYRDEDTGDHIQRMSLMSAAIARAMGWSEKVIERLLYAAPMHDIGKIGIPDSILVKPGKLDAEEWKIMKTHTTIGAKILEGSSFGFLRLGKMIALTHHEKWDGSGYPYGLAGKKIPLIGRIVAVADVFDALTTKRPYKEAFPQEKALAIVKEGRGNHFDPDVVDVFFSILPEVEKIQDQCRQAGFSPLFAEKEWRPLLERSPRDQSGD